MLDVHLRGMFAARVCSDVNAALHEVLPQPWTELGLLRLPDLLVLVLGDHLVGHLCDFSLCFPDDLRASEQGVVEFLYSVIVVLNLTEWQEVLRLSLLHIALLNFKLFIHNLFHLPLHLLSALFEFGILPVIHLLLLPLL